MVRFIRLRPITDKSIAHFKILFSIIYWIIKVLKENDRNFANGILHLVPMQYYAKN